MLQLEDVRKSYTTGDFTQTALDDVSISFRDNEFVAILGPSGSGKTTLLNIIGGLDHYDSGNLIIDGVPTEDYLDRDWDTYRNNRIGFVFQSYNLIPHQTVLSNVELALTLAGVSPAERRERATEALKEVGLGDHIHKRPNQLSGGQMQRVAIARALINDPEILLADEPTGALDSTTSDQIMHLLTGIAQDRLVIMVTHNPELAEQYATRIVQLKDGVVATDSDPFDPEHEPLPDHSSVRHTSMSFFTAIALSFNNLMTKKGRTLMTSFAGSIGIIGIAAILALANGVNLYIKGVEEDTLSMYPLSIQRQGFDMASMLAATAGMTPEDDGTPEREEGTAHEIKMLTSMFGGVGTNDLESLKRYFDDNGGGINEYVNSIEYSYDVTPLLYSEAWDRTRQVNPDTTFNAIGFDATSSVNSLMGPGANSVFNELVGDLSLVESQYEVVAGHWPRGADETVVVLTPGGGVSDYTLYAMGLRDPSELDQMVRQMANEEEITLPETIMNVPYQDLLDVTFTLVNAPDLYSYDETYQVWVDNRNDEALVQRAVDEGDEIRVVGLVKPSGDGGVLRPGIYYTTDLTKQVIERAQDTAIVRDQLAKPGTDVFSGRPFGEAEQTEFDMQSLVTVDEEALARAFTFDQSKLTVDLSALQGLDLPTMQFDAAALPQFDLDSMMAGLDLASLITMPDLGTEGGQLSDWVTALTQGYQQFVVTNQLDPTQVEANFEQFLASPEGQALLIGTPPPAPEPQLPTIDADTVASFLLGLSRTADAAEVNLTDPGVIADLLASPQGQQVAQALAAVDPALPGQIAQGYSDFIVSSGLEGTDAAAAVAAFLASPQGQEILAGLQPDATPAPEPAPAQPPVEPGLLTQLVQGYLRYTVDSGADIADVETNLNAFLSSPAGRDVLAQAGGLVDTTALEAQLQTAMAGYLQQVMGAVSQQLAGQLEWALTSQITRVFDNAMGQLATAMPQAMGIDQDAFMAAFTFNRSQEELTQLFASMAAARMNTYEANLRTLGYADPADPSGISIYPKDFESKTAVITILDDYNARAESAGDEDRVITYTDFVGALMGSVTDILNVITAVLVAFVAISLIVSSIMIGVITYISVLERRKEIGILRAVGASKRDIRRVFNAETLIVGFIAGALGVIITYLLTFPANAIIEHRFGIADVVQLPLTAALILVGISMVLTVLAGLIPSSAASRKDPVEALRSE